MSANHVPSNGDAVDKETATYADPKPTAERVEDTMVELRENYVRSGRRSSVTFLEPSGAETDTATVKGSWACFNRDMSSSVPL